MFTIENMGLVRTLNPMSPGTKKSMYLADPDVMVDWSKPMTGGQDVVGHSACRLNPFTTPFTTANTAKLEVSAGFEYIVKSTLCLRS